MNITDEINKIIKDALEVKGPTYPITSNPGRSKGTLTMVKPKYRIYFRLWCDIAAEHPLYCFRHGTQEPRIDLPNGYSHLEYFIVPLR